MKFNVYLIKDQFKDLYEHMSNFSFVQRNLDDYRNIINKHK